MSKLMSDKRQSQYSNMKGKNVPLDGSQYKSMLASGKFQLHSINGGNAKLVPKANLAKAGFHTSKRGEGGGKGSRMRPNKKQSNGGNWRTQARNPKNGRFM